MRRNSKAVIAAVAAAAGLPTDGFSVEESEGIVLVNHPDSMTWPEKWPAIRAAAERASGMKASIT